MKRWEIPEFGNWDYCDKMPITQYFESARQAGLIRAAASHHGAACDEDLFKVPVAVAVPVKAVYHDGHYHRKVRKGSNSSGEEKPTSKEQKDRKQRTVSGDPAVPRRKLKPAPKPVDEDLYKIPPELLYQKPKRKRLLGNMLSGCLGLNCIA